MYMYPYLSLYVYKHIYTYTVHIYIYIYIYMYREREREIHTYRAGMFASRLISRICPHTQVYQRAGMSACLLGQL